jgi:hypothetical protein
MLVVQGDRTRIAMYLANKAKEIGAEVEAALKADKDNPKAVDGELVSALGPVAEDRIAAEKEQADVRNGPPEFDYGTLEAVPPPSRCAPWECGCGR